MSGGTNWPWALSVLTALALAVGLFLWVRAGTKKWLPRSARKPLLYLIVIAGTFISISAHKAWGEGALGALVLTQLAIMFGVLTAD